MTEFPPSHCPDCGGKLVAVAPPRYHCPACGRSVYHAPTLAASVAVVDGPVVLLGKRAAPPSEGRWTLPGGHVDLGEDPLTAAARELEEETGLAADPADLSLFRARTLAPVEARGRTSTKHVVSVDYVVPASATEGEPAADDDLDEVRWVHAEELADTPLAYEDDADVLRAATRVDPECV